MKKITFIIATLTLLLSASPASAASRTSGYFKKNGTYVAPYYKSTPNSTKIDNYSSKGNSNPFTGKKGYVNPYKFKW